MGEQTAAGPEAVNGAGAQEQAAVPELVRALREEVAALRGEVRAVRQGLAELASLLRATPENVAAIKAERDDYLKSLHALTRKEFSLREEELPKGPREGPTLEALIDGWRRELP